MAKQISMDATKVEEPSANPKQAGFSGAPGSGPFYWERRFGRRGAWERPKVNHKPNSFSRYETARKHAVAFTQSYRQYGEPRNQTAYVRIYDNRRCLADWTVTPNIRDDLRGASPR